MKKRFTDEQIISILREAESKEIATVDLCKRHNVTEQTFCRWRNKFGGMDVSDARLMSCAAATVTSLPLIRPPKFCTLEAWIYTCGISTSCVLPSASVTAYLTSQTLSVFIAAPLRIGEGDSHHVALGLRHLQAGVHERLVLRFVAAVADQIALAGDLLDLALHQLLFIETIAQLPYADRSTRLVYLFNFYLTEVSVALVITQARPRYLKCELSEYLESLQIELE